MWQIWSLVTSVYKHYKPRCAAMLVMIDFSTFVVSQLGNIKGGSLLVESVLWISRRTKSSFFLLSLAVLCRFVFFYISFVSGRLPRLTDSFQAFWGGGEEARVVLSARYVSSATLATCTARKRGTISLDGMSFSEKKKITKITCLPFKCFTANILDFDIWCSVQPFNTFTERVHFYSNKNDRPGDDGTLRSV